MNKICLILLVMVFIIPCAIAESLSAWGYENETVSRQWESNLFFERMHTLTGVNVQGHGISEEGEYEKFLSELEEGKTEADLLVKANLTREQEERLLNSGALVDLSSYIEEMPNLSALLSENPQWRKEIALEDGRIASLPQINRHPRQVCVWINASWLNKLGLEMPETIEDLTQVLRAIRDGDPNGNGTRDERAADIIGVYELRWLLPYFGILANDYHVAQTESGEVVFAPDLPEYREFVSCMRTWYEEGILPSDTFTAQHMTLESISGQNQTVKTLSGILITPILYTDVAAEDVTGYEALLLKDQSGQIRWRDFQGEIWNGTLAVTSRCKDIHSALAWADALYGEEGAMLAYAGEENYDYVVNQDGTWDYLSGNTRGMEDIRRDSIFYTGVTMPGLVPSEFVERINSPADRWIFSQSEKVREKTVPIGSFLSDEQRKKANELVTILGEKVDAGIARFVSGEVELTDQTWQNWLEDLHESHSSELTDLFK